MVVSPCKGCKDRSVGCHAKCKRYIDWKDMKTKENEYEREMQSNIGEHSTLGDYHMPKINKRKRK